MEFPDAFKTSQFEAYVNSVTKSFVVAVRGISLTEIYFQGAILPLQVPDSDTIFLLYDEETIEATLLTRHTTNLGISTLSECGGDILRATADSR